MTAHVITGVNSPSVADMVQHFTRQAARPGPGQEVARAFLDRFNSETVPQFRAAFGREPSLADLAAIPAPINGADDEAMNGFFKDVGNFFKRVGRGIANVVNKVNPILVAGRTAFLSLVRDNRGGLATKLNSKREAVLNKWQVLGGDRAILKTALDHGAGQPIGALPDPEDYTDSIGMLPLLAALAPSVAAEAVAPGAPASDKKPGLVAKVFQIAKPLIEMILKAVGLNLGGNEPLARAMEEAPATSETLKVQEAVSQAQQTQPVERALTVIRQRPTFNRDTVRGKRPPRSAQQGTDSALLLGGLLLAGYALSK